MDIDWADQLAEQLGWHWQEQLRPRLDGHGAEISLLRDLCRDRSR